MVDVEVDDRDAAGTVDRLRVPRRDGGGVEQAEAHWRRDLGVVAGRAHREERVGVLAVHHRVDGAHRATDRVHHAAPGAPGS